MPCQRLLCAVFLALSIAVLAAAPAVAGETPDQTFAVSVTEDGTFADAGVHPPVSISADGRFVAFVSAASNLDAEAPLGVAEVYVKDLDTGAVELVSRASGASGAPADPQPIGEHQPGQIEDAEISADGRYVVFSSPADNLVDGLPLPVEVAEERLLRHVYRRDLQTGETILVDRVSGPAGAVTATEARVAAIAGGGRYVLFGSHAEDLEDPGGAHEEGRETLYVRDLLEGTTTAVGRAGDTGGQPGDLAAEGSFDGDLTPDGRYVVFSSPSANLDPEANGLFQVYRRDLQTGATVLVSRTSGSGSAPIGEPSDGEAFEPSFVGADGCRVAFTALEAANLFGPGKAPLVATYVRDLCATPPTTTLASVDEAGQPFEEGVLEGAGDGALLLKATGSPGPSHIYLRDLIHGTTAAVDRAGGAGGALGDDLAEAAAISANGCRAVFTSAAANLTAQAPPEPGSSRQLQVYARQLAPCKPVKGGPGPGGGPGRGGDPTPPLRLGVTLISRRRLWLDFGAAATATVRIERAGSRHRWLLVRTLHAQARGPETVRLRFGALSGGVYRFTIQPQVPDARRLTARLEVGRVRRGGGRKRDGNTLQIPKRSSTEALRD